MAKDTPESFRNLVIYELFVRNHTPEGTFAAAIPDLTRIRQMGVDVIWLMPIHPIGKIGNKGDLGSPYSIVDYRAINPAYGTLEDFKAFIQAVHAAGMRLIIDVVYNHTARDSRLVAEHPDWFHQDAHGQPFSTVPEWTDVIDLNHPIEPLADYLIETLKMWVEMGVDGFRCDVAPLVPIEFWLKARQAVGAVRPGVLWLSESIDVNFIHDRRTHGLRALCDAEIYQAFDLTYDYDIWATWQKAVTGQLPLSRYLDLLIYQDCVHPVDSIKMRCVENHDNQRIMALAPTREQALAWTAFQAFNRGAFLIYGGQESGATHTPVLWVIDRIAWGDYALQPFLTRLNWLKQDPAVVSGAFRLLAASRGIQAAWQGEPAGLYGIFNVNGEAGPVEVQLPDGIYTNLLNDEPIAIRGGRTEMPAIAAILRGALPAELQGYRSALL